MNDKDIIKALLECSNNGYNDKNGSCKNCPYIEVADFPEKCMTMMAKDALDLIKRQQAEIERLEEELANPVVSYTHIYAEDVVKVGFDTKRAIVKATRAEATKEFAERWHNALKETRNRGFLKEPTIVSKTFEIASNITNIVVKEMLGKEDEGK